MSSIENISRIEDEVWKYSSWIESNISKLESEVSYSVALNDKEKKLIKDTYLRLVSLHATLQKFIKNNTEKILEL